MFKDATGATSAVCELHDHFGRIRSAQFTLRPLHLHLRGTTRHSHRRQSSQRRSIGRSQLRAVSKRAKSRAFVFFTCILALSPGLFTSLYFLVHSRGFDFIICSRTLLPRTVITLVLQTLLDQSSNKWISSGITCCTVMTHMLILAMARALLKTGLWSTESLHLSAWSWFQVLFARFCL